MKSTSLVWVLFYSCLRCLHRFQRGHIHLTGPERCIVLRQSKQYVGTWSSVVLSFSLPRLASTLSVQVQFQQQQQQDWQYARCIATNVFRCSLQPCNALQCNLICLFYCCGTPCTDPCCLQETWFILSLSVNICWNCPLLRASVAWSCRSKFWMHACGENCVFILKVTILEAKKTKLYSSAMVQTCCL